MILGLVLLKVVCVVIKEAGSTTSADKIRPPCSGCSRIEIVFHFGDVDLANQLKLEFL